MLRELLELAPGSRWDEYGDIESGDGHSFGICAATGSARFVSGSGPAVDIQWTADHRDIIALLHRAGLLDELLAEAWDEGRTCGWDNAMDEAHYERPYPHKNPYRKAGK